MDFEHPTLQGVNAMAIRTPRVSLRLPRAMRLLGIIGCTSAIQANLIAFGLRDNSVRLKLNPKL